MIEENDDIFRMVKMTSTNRKLWWARSVRHVGYEITGSSRPPIV